MDEHQKPSAKITIKPTTPTLDLYEHAYNGEQTIQKIKQTIATHYSVEYQQIKLIFKGRILTDRQTAGQASLADSVVMLVINKKAEPPKKNNTDQTIPRIPSSFTTGMGGTMPVGFGGYSMINHPQYMSAMSGAVNQEKIDQLLNDPQSVSMMEDLMQDPDTLRYMIEQNPMLKSMFNQNPMMKMVLDNPQLMKQVFNPEMLKMSRELMKNQQNETMPNLGSTQAQGQGNGPALAGLSGLGGLGGLGMGGLGMGGLGMGGLGGLGGLYGGMNQQANQGTQASNAGQANQNPQVPLMPAFNPFMSPMFNPMMTNMFQPQPQAPKQQTIEQKYKNQLKQLQSMGFKDREQNIKALIESKGDVDGAIERLCQD